MNTMADSSEDIRNQLGSLISYLRDLHALRNPPIRNVAQHASYRLNPEQLAGLPGVTIQPSADIWLTAELLVPPEEPELPRELIELTVPRLFGKIRPVPQAEVDAAGKEQVERWTSSVWDTWKQQVEIVEKSRRLYLELFGIRNQLEADSSNFELIWGFGIVRWREHDIEHPLFTVGLELEYTAENARLHLRPARSLRAETEVLTGLPLVAQPQLFEAMTAIEVDDIDPWIQGFEANLLTPLLLMMSHTPREDGGPKILPGDWAIFVRRKPSGYLNFVRGLEANLDLLATLPTLASLVATDPRQFDVVDLGATSSEGRWNSTGTEVLLPLPANDEQREILRHAASSPGVTVEGPPGTGKSHTIANLISGFIADGKRVLVTAERSQALKVLLDKIPEALQPLCVPVLGSGQEERMRLENAIDRISLAATGLNENRSVAERLPSLLDDTTRSIAEIHNLLREARQVEVLPVPDFVPFDCRESRASLADWLHQHESDHSFVTDALAPDAVLPWTTFDQEQILTFFRSASAEDLTRARDIATSVSLPTGQELSQQIHHRDSLILVADGSSDVFEGTELQSEDDLASLAEQIVLASEQISHWELGARRIAFQELTFGPKQQLWRVLAQDLATTIQRAFALRAVQQAHQIEIPGDVPFDPNEIKALAEAQKMLEEGKRLGFSHRHARQISKKCRVDGRIPSSASDFALVSALSDLRLMRFRISNQLNSVRESLGTPIENGASVEDEASPISAELSAMVDWLDIRWPAYHRKLNELGVRCDRVVNSVTLKAAHAALQARLAASRVSQLDANFSLLLEELNNRLRTSTAPELWRNLLESIAKQDWSAWDETLTEIRRLTELQELSHNLNLLLDRLYERAPLWAEELRATGHLPAQSDDDIALAWNWRKAETWFRSTEVAVDPDELELELRRLERVQQAQVAQLAAARAWLTVIDRVDGPTQGALAAYKAVNARLGRGYSKFKSTYQRQLDEALAGCRHVIPAWVMPVERVLTDFACENEPIFDVLIIDEASQLPMTRLPIFALARKVIVVGDDKQISPSLPGVGIQPTLDALNNRLQDITNAGATYFIEASVYDVAMQRFPRKVQLREHFRCLTPIIEFSNSRYYDERLVPLRDRMPSLHWKPLNSVLVSNGFRDNDDCNRPEAERIAELIAEMIQRPDYFSRSFGVITLLGKNQSKLIHDLVFEAIGPAKMTAHAVRIGDAATFQGDERHVILISTVVSDSGGRTIGAMTRKLNQQMVNVAASRARDQLWIIHSVPADSFPNGDERAALIRHCSATVSAAEAYEELAKKTDDQSPFERDLLRHVVGRGYRTIRPQHQVGRYRIDFVIDGPSSRLAVECDGDRFHGPEQWDADRARQAVLERAGWTFVRIRGSSFYRNPAKALEPLWAKLDELDIPSYDWTRQTQEVTHGTPISPFQEAKAEEFPQPLQITASSKGVETNQPDAEILETAPNTRTRQLDLPDLLDDIPVIDNDPWAAAFQAADERIRESGRDDSL